MNVKIKILGLPEVPPAEENLELAGQTLGELRELLFEQYPQLAPLEGTLLAFVNRKTVRGDWKEVALSDDDSLLFVVPISGG